MGYIRDCSAGHTDLKTTKSYSSGSSSRLRCLLHRSWKAQRIQPAPFNGRIQKLKWMPLVSCGLARQTPVSWQLPRVPWSISIKWGKPQAPQPPGCDQWHPGLIGPNPLQYHVFYFPPRLWTVNERQSELQQLFLRYPGFSYFICCFYFEVCKIHYSYFYWKQPTPKKVHYTAWFSIIFYP